VRKKGETWSKEPRNVLPVVKKLLLPGKGGGDGGGGGRVPYETENEAGHLAKHVR